MVPGVPKRITILNFGKIGRSIIKILQFIDFFEIVAAAVFDF